MLEDRIAWAEGEQPRAAAGGRRLDHLADAADAPVVAAQMRLIRSMPRPMPAMPPPRPTQARAPCRDAGRHRHRSRGPIDPPPRDGATTGRRAWFCRCRLGQRTRFSWHLMGEPYRYARKPVPAEPARRGRFRRPTGRSLSSGHAGSGRRPHDLTCLATALATTWMNRDGLVGCRRLSGHSSLGGQALRRVSRRVLASAGP